VMQVWRLTRFTAVTVHEWAMFIKPEELVVTFGRHGLLMGEIVGRGPRSSKPLVLWNFIGANRGRITYGELSRRLDAGQVKSTRISYMGFATKAG
jgi:2-polyprenyl-6-hydroxyphenyl methylase/3-demethylubiquinone-9 3-methyltransferase